MLKRIFIISFLATVWFTANAQSLEDAVRYSLIYSESTARSVGTGSAIGPMGVDFGAFGSNPAGLGRLRISEAALSFGANFTNSDVQYQDGNLSNSQGDIQPVLNNIGLAFASPGRRAKWKNKNFAISVSRLADFNRDIQLTDRTPGSITDRFLDLAEGSFPQDLDIFEAGLAFDVLAIDTLPGSPTSYFSDLVSASTVQKAIEHKSSGSLNELQLTFGSNYDNKLLVGLGLGLAFLDYKAERIHREEDNDNSIPFFSDLTFSDKLESVGAGVNVKAGLIYMPSRQFFISLSGQTPTWYLLTDTYETSLEYAFDADNNNDVFFDEVSPNDFEYTLNTPWRVTGGLGVIINNIGFVSAEVEYLDYTFAQFNLTRNNNNSANSAGTDQINADIDAVLTSAINFRLGGELAFDAWRVRAGFAIAGTPFLDSDEGTTSVSAGLGYRVNKLYFDLGVRATFRDELYFPYFTFAPPQPIIDNKITDLSAVLSVGTKF